jgi:cellulose synthase/poly-beta-1,6-N-acetylglucosamine synthase-like glycosyltransferase
MFSLIFLLVFLGCWACIAYTYIGFPIILAALARRKRSTAIRPVADIPTRQLPRITMVVAAYNEALVLRDKLANTWALDYPTDRLQILIGSDGSSDGTAEILRTCDDPRLISFLFEQRRGKISILNDLMQAVTTDIVVLSDANTMLAPDALRKLVRHFRDPEVGCVSGELALEQAGGVSGEGLYWKYENWIKRNEGRLGFLMGCNGGLFAIRRPLYQRLPISTIVEDFVLTLRVLEQGYQVVFEPEARATEPACPSSKAEMVRKIRIGAGGWQALGLTSALLHPRHGVRAFAFWGHKVLRWMVPVFAAVALAANVALLQSAVGQMLLGLQLAGLGAGVLAYQSGPNRRLPGLLRPVGYFYLMNYALGCGLVRFLCGTQKVTWERGGAVQGAASPLGATSPVSTEPTDPVRAPQAQSRRTTRGVTA